MATTLDGHTLNSDQEPDHGGTETGTCALCGRDGLPLTRHHLIPRMRHRNKRTRRTFERGELTGRILWVCQPCHNHVHATLAEKALAEFYNTRARLLAHPDIARFSRWIASRPAGLKPKGPGRR
jgi:5-methylcytosine-specific restriction endonuclease McrA